MRKKGIRMFEFITLVILFYFMAYKPYKQNKLFDAKTKQLDEVLEKYGHQETFTCERDELSLWSDEEIKKILGGKFTLIYT